MRPKTSWAAYPLFAGAEKSASLFDMKKTDFLELVASGHLPGPLDLGGHRRWDVEELSKIARGEALEGGGLEW
jgi:hypothetical protein